MKRLSVLALAAVLAAAWMIAGWGHPLLPDPHNGGRTAAALGKSDWPVLGAHQPVLGVDLYALNDYSASEVRDYGRRMLGYIKKVLKADAVGIVWNFYSSSLSSDSVKATDHTLSPRNVAILTRIATQDHLLVEYRPIILVPSAASPWEGKITPGLQPRWFDSYYQAELPYLRMAQKLGVREFVTATEMVELNTSPLWSLFFTRVSRVYHGVISYGAWDGNYFGVSPDEPLTRAAPQLLPAKYVGMDMYWPLNLPPTATSAQVTAAWESLFGKVPPALLRRTAIDETGIQARAGAYLNPPDLGSLGQLSEAVQANWFAAACATVRRYHMRGVFFFKVDLTDNPAHPASSLSTFEGRAAAAAIAECAHTLH